LIIAACPAIVKSVARSPGVEGDGAAPRAAGIGATGRAGADVPDRALRSAQAAIGLQDS
jgi:hypothetical protein